MRRAPGNHGIQLCAPPREQTQALLRVANFIAQIIGPAAECVDVIEVLMQPLGQQEADHLEILVVVGCQPARVLKRFFYRPLTIQLLRGGEKSGGSEEHGGTYGMIAVFRCPLWLIRCCITWSRFASGSTRFTRSLAVM